MIVSQGAIKAVVPLLFLADSPPAKSATLRCVCLCVCGWVAVMRLSRAHSPALDVRTH